MAKIQKHLKELSHILSSQELTSVLLEATEEAPYDRLLIYLGKDYKQRERVLEVIAQKEEMGRAIHFNKDPEEYVRMQFQITLPFEYEESAFRDVASLLFFLNRFIELPGFALNEEDNQIYYRYVLFFNEKGDYRSLWIATVGSILFLIDLFTESLEQISSKQMSFDSLLEKVVEISRRAQKSDPSFS